MNPQSKLGDVGVGVCKRHSKPFTTTFVNGPDDVLVNGKPISTVSITGVATCGCNTTAVVGSSTVYSAQKNNHRVSDTGVTDKSSVYATVSGSPNVKTGG